MSSLIVEVCEVLNVTPHENADKLDCIQVKGWNCIVGKGQYKTGDLVVFVPPDCVITDEIIEKYNLSYLKGNNRTGTIKLRGIISQGLILDLPDGKYKVGDDVSNVLGIKKYEQPEPKYNPRSNNNPVSKKRSNPFFAKYTDIENVKNYNGIFKNGDMVVISEKIHGCLKHDTRISLADGTKKSIKEIVDNNLDVEILGTDDIGEIVPTKILHWYNNDKTSKWINIKYSRRGFGTTGNSYGSLYCTPNHQIFCNGHYINAENCKSDDIVLMIKNIDEISYIQQSVLVGKMIGDGGLNMKNGSASMDFSHKKDHLQYLEYTLRCLGDIAGNRQTNRMSGYGTEMTRARTINSSGIYQCFKDWFVDGKKIIPDNVRLSPIALAFLYMDDGSLGHDDKQEDRANFALCDYDEKSIDNFVNNMWIQNNIECKKHQDASGYWRVRLNAKEAIKLFIIIAPYICPIMQYKIPKQYRSDVVYLNNIDTEVSSLLVEKKILSVEIVETNETKYDLETETHNFFANDILVHNSNWRCGTLPITIDFKQPFFYLIRTLFQKYILGHKFESVYGSHNIQLNFGNSNNTYYGENVYGKICEKYHTKNIPEFYTVYGEIIGKGIQDLTYGLSGIDMYVFDVKYKDEYLGWNDVKDFCKKMGYKTVPELYIGEYNDDILEQYTDGKSMICPTQIREGCVIKTLNEDFNPRIGRKILKSVSTIYLTRKNGTEFK